MQFESKNIVSSLQLKEFDNLAAMLRKNVVRAFRRFQISLDKIWICDEYIFRRIFFRQFSREFNLQPDLNYQRISREYIRNRPQK